MGVEFELKYAADAGQQAQVLAQFPGTWETIAMETTYYDTPGGELEKRWFTLRRRMENGSSVCTIKTPTGQNARGEWECECDSIEAAIPELCKLGAPKVLLLLTLDGVVQVCGARFTRRAKLVELADCTVEIAVDSGVLMGGGREIPLQEVEVELKSGDRAAAAAFAEMLAARLGMKKEPGSKFRRALALAKGE